jgi:site-specific DNA-methyltransferase (adenine-specific)
MCIRAGRTSGDAVHDLFAAIGTTGVAALKLGRRFVGIELIPDFVYSAGERLQAAEPAGPSASS